MDKTDVQAEAATEREVGTAGECNHHRRQGFGIVAEALSRELLPKFSIIASLRLVIRCAAFAPADIRTKACLEAGAKAAHRITKRRLAIIENFGRSSRLHA